MGQRIRLGVGCIIALLLSLWVVPRMDGGWSKEVIIQDSPIDEPEAFKEAIAKKQLYYQGDRSRRWVALTFDDGPDEYYTKRVLDILRREGVKATFFVVGELMQRNPRLLQRMVREGHVIGNHTWSHPYLPYISRAEAQKEIYRTQWIIQNLVGKRPRLIRPPFGSMNKRLVRMLSDHGFTVVHWSVDTRDWSGRSASSIIETIQQGVHPGAIILQHSAGGEQRLHGTLEALPKIIRFLRRSGYKMVTVDQLLRMKAYR
ncbi:polysaccharide deacetylase family protein [Pasteuria penetrans]|uniref:polysaccharide deacetylase family protein n=1 Tax=Pasteuria penetrans TaxID=86005 RepID=UPI000FA433A4|nr:polysaccharide deacetylase family protein [Pasteuria penetrans]